MFDWPTDKSSEPMELPAAPEEALKRSRRRLTLLAVAAASLVLAGLAFFGLRQEAARQDTAEGEALLHSHNLLREAAGRGDGELAALLVSGADPDWQSQMIAVAAQPLLLDRSLLGLHLETAMPQDVAVHLAPDRQTAEVRSRYAYQAAQMDAGPAEIQLEQTLLYRRQSAGWRLARPDPAFWGATQTVEGRWLTLHYPEKDAAVAERLAADLDAWLARACETLPRLDCPADWRLTLRLETDPLSLAVLADPQNALTAGPNVVLPAPSLIGMPVDEAAYQALQRGYAGYLLAAAGADLLNWECCSGSLLFQALVDWDLHQLGVRPWPLTPADYEALLYDSATLAGARRAIDAFWDVPLLTAVRQPERRAVYGLVEFMATRDPESVTPELRYYLTRPGHQWQWYRAGTVTGPPVDDLERTWFDFTMARAALDPFSPATPPLAWPTQPLQLLCQPNPAAVAAYRYDFAGRQWQKEWELLDHALLSWLRLPEGRGTLLQVRPLDSMLAPQESQLLWWPDGEQRRLLSDDAEGLPWRLMQASPAGPWAVLAAFTGLEPRLALLDLEACAGGDCALQRLDGRPLAWSPDGAWLISQSLNLEPNGANLYLAAVGSADEALLGPGLMPFWLDDERFGYVQEWPGPPLSPEVRVVIAGVTGDEPQTLFSLAELLAALPELTTDYRPPYRLGQVTVAPTGPDHFYFLLHHYDEPATHLVHYDRASRLFSRQGEVAGFAGFYDPHLSPDGRWLVLGSRTQDVVSLHLYDLAEETSKTFNHRWPGDFYRWSADGRWLVSLESDTATIKLVAPAYDFQQFIPIDSGAHRCWAVGWEDE
jgi:hypothetical protein